MLCVTAQMTQLATQPNSPAKAQQEQTLQKQKKALETELGQKAQALLHARLVGKHTK